MTDLAARVLAAIEETEQAWRAGLAGARRNGKNTARMVLQRCEADRRVLNRHTYNPINIMAWDRKEPVGQRCGVDHQPVPCPDLLDLAARYDITEEDG